jgi:formylglycine-generating enzyme
VPGGRGFGECKCVDGGATGGSGGGGAGGTGGSSGVGAAGSGGSAGTGPDASDDAPVVGCPSGLTGPGLVEVAAPNAAKYCVDSTEVTNAQYAAFVADSPATAQQRPECKWNVSFDPATSPFCSERTDATVRPNHPIVCVDWCDAVAYCVWAGKRLCGRVGGGTSDYNGLSDATVSQWFNACSAQGANTYPYGNVYEPQTCKGGDVAPGGDVVGARTMQGCHGPTAPWSAVHDMSGNAQEWEDACESSAGMDDLCRMRGGATGHASANLRCDTSSARARNYRDLDIGFRCCVH